jgi:hypothetical protein
MAVRPTWEPTREHLSCGSEIESGGIHMGPHYTPRMSSIVAAPVEPAPGWRHSGWLLAAFEALRNATAVRAVIALLVVGAVVVAGTFLATESLGSAVFQ